MFVHILNVKLGNFTFESDMARADFENRVIEKTRAARSILSQLPSWLWKCETPKSEQLENETFIQFTEVLQVSNFPPLYTCSRQQNLILVAYLA